jgi:cellulose synthase/poly-beta-1,6-N-acetylglucosamine synthase-like glycosyltransferase
VQVNRNHWGASICVGSNAVYHRTALVDVGGTAEIGHSEDVHTGFYALTRGWRLTYIPLALACGMSPNTAKAFFSQQMWWCAGSTTLLTNPDFWRSNLGAYTEDLLPERDDVLHRCGADDDLASSEARAVV